MTPLLQIALTLFIVSNPIGNSPTIVALVKNYPIKRQQKILLRESMFAMALAIFFLFFGELFLNALQIQDYALTFCGGILLFLVALKMIFSTPDEANTETLKQEPFIVPIATPLLSGAGLMAMIMLYAKKEANNPKVLLAILIAWVGITAILVAAPYLQVFLGKRGLAALEQLMGMLLSMIAMQMIVDGSTIFLTALQAV